MAEVFDPFELERVRVELRAKGQEMRGEAFDPLELERSRLEGKTAREAFQAEERLPPEVGMLSALTEPEAQPGLFMRAMLKGATLGQSEKLMPGPALKQLAPPAVTGPAEMMGEFAPIMGISSLVRGGLKTAPRVIRWLEPGVVGMLYGSARELGEGERDPRKVIVHGAKTGAAFQVFSIGLGAIAGLTNYIGSRVLARTGAKLPKEALESAVERSIGAPDESVVEALGYNFEALTPSQRQMITKHSWEIARAEMEYRGFQNPDTIPTSDWFRMLKMGKGSRGAFQEMKAAPPGVAPTPAPAAKVPRLRAPKGKKQETEQVVAKPKTIFAAMSEREIPGELMTTPEAKATVDKILLESQIIEATRPPKYMQVEGAHLPGGPLLEGPRIPTSKLAAPKDLIRKGVELKPPSMSWAVITEKAVAKNLKISPERGGWKIEDGETIWAQTLDDVVEYINIYPGGRGGPGAMGPVPPPPIMPGQAPKLVWEQPKQIDMFPMPEEAKYLTLQLEGRSFNEVGIIAYAVDPIWVGRAANMAPEFERIVGTVDKFVDIKGVFMQKMRVWMKRTGIRTAVKERMWRSLVTGKPIPADAPHMTTQEMSVLDEMRVAYRQFLDFINQERVKIGLAPVPGDMPYAPGMIDDSIQTLMRYSEEWGGKGTQAIPPEFWKSLAYSIPEDKFLGHVLERHGRVPYKQDVYATFEAYISSVTKAMAARELLPFIKQLVAKGSPVPTNVKNYLEFMAKTELLGRPNKMDIYFQMNMQRMHKSLMKNIEKIPRVGEKLAWRHAHMKLLKNDAVTDVVFKVPRMGWMLTPRPVTRLVRAYKTLSYMSLIGMNFKTMLLNLSQPIIGPALMKGGPVRAWSDWFHGYGKATAEFLRPFTKGIPGTTKYAAERAAVIQKYENLGVLSMMEELYTPTGQFGALKQKFVDFTFWNMRTSEFLNRVSMYYGKTRNLKLVEKVFDEEARQISRQFSNLINFRYGGAWRSRAMAENPIANLAGQYQTFTIKHLTLLGSMAKGLKDPSTIPKFYLAMERGRGVEYLEAMPMFERTALLRYMLAASAVATGLSLFEIPFFQMLGRSLTPGFGPGIDAMIHGIKAINSGDPKQIDNVIRDLTNIIPLKRFGEQTGIIEGYQAPIRPGRGGRGGRESR
jgi:hypothetical protein